MEGQKDLMNINNYIERKGHLTFEQMKFNELDSLILSELSYMNLDLVAPSIHNPKAKKPHIKDLDLTHLSAISYGSVDNKRNEKMLKLMMESKRFQDIKVCYTHRIFDEKNYNQFFAVTFIFPNGDAYLSFRGTDITMVGWKEDFLMTFKPLVLSQKESMEYFKCVIKHIKGNFYLGGHSKGGNLAMYVALNIDQQYEDRLIKAYSFDGPGFKEDIINHDTLERIEHKLVKYMTYNDVIGVVFNKHKKPHIVESNGVLLGGHDPFYWQVNIKTHSFKKKRDRSAISKKSEVGFNNWMNSISNEDRELAFDVLFRLFKEVKTVYDLISIGLPAIITKRNKIVKEYPKDEQKRIKMILDKLIKSFMKALTTPLKSLTQK